MPISSYRGATASLVAHPPTPCKRWKHEFDGGCLCARSSSCSLSQSNWDEVVDNFDDMNLRDELLRGIYAYGFEKPSAIQQRAIIPCVKGESLRLIMDVS